MWNVVGPFEVGSPADLAVVSEVVQSRNRCLYLAEEVSEVQTAVTVADSAVVEAEGRIVGGVEVSVEAEAASVVDVTTLGVVDAGVATAGADSGVYCVPQSQLRLTIFQVVAEVEALDTKVEGGSVSTQVVGLGGHQTVLVGMALRAVVTEVATAAAAEGSVHREVAVGMEVGTVPTLNGRAQGWTRIAIQSDQGIEHIFSGVPSGSHHGVSLPECFLFTFSRSWPCSHVLRHLV